MSVVNELLSNGFELQEEPKPNIIAIVEVRDFAVIVTDRGVYRAVRRWYGEKLMLEFIAHL
jgi:hypothetical protein